MQSAPSTRNDTARVSVQNLMREALRHTPTGDTAAFVGLRNVIEARCAPFHDRACIIIAEETAYGEVAHVHNLLLPLASALLLRRACIVGLRKFDPRDLRSDFERASLALHGRIYLLCTDPAIVAELVDSNEFSVDVPPWIEAILEFTRSTQFATRESLKCVKTTCTAPAPAPSTSASSVPSVSSASTPLKRKHSQLIRHASDAAAAAAADALGGSLLPAAATQNGQMDGDDDDDDDDEVVVESHGTVCGPPLRRVLLASASSSAGVAATTAMHQTPTRARVNKPKHPRHGGTLYGGRTLMDAVFNTPCNKA